MDTVVQYGLLAVFFMLVLTPVGFPVPEDITLLGAGVLAHMGHADLLSAYVVGYCGVFGGDLIAFHMGKRVGLEPKGMLARLVGQDDLRWIERFYAKYGAFAIVIARQFPGMRLPAFFFAGATGVPLRRFIAFDGSAAFITVGVFVTLGHTFGDDLNRIIKWLDSFRLVGVATVLSLIGVVGWRIMRKRLRRRKLEKNGSRH